jgi:lipoprotein-anchoring transpeptidase ErfK/SrfK
MVSLGASAAALALTFASAVPAEAQFFFDYGSYNAPYGKPVKRKKNRAQPTDISRAGREDDAKADKAFAERKPEGPLVLTVSLRRQRVSVYDSRGLMMEAPISSGRVGNSTPTGVFSILQKNRTHFSNLYDSAPMPNMQRITWSGVALHAGVLPGYPASHGCIRLPHGFSKKLFELTKIGTRVIVSQDPVQPVAFDHPRLFATYPASTDMHALVPSETRVADASDARAVPPVEVGSVISVSTALAAGAPSPMEAIEAMRAQRREELERLAAAITEAEAAKSAAVAKATAMVKAADGAKLALRTARTEANRLAAAARKAAQARDAAGKKLEAFERGLIRKTSFTPEEINKAAMDEDRLETEAMDLDDAAATAAAEAMTGATALATAEKAMAEADKARAESVNAVRGADIKLSQAREADAAAKRREAKRKEPVHVFISRKTQKIYVRQGYEPILEAPVTIEQPDRPLGTHVFTALAVDPSKADVNWSVASIPTSASGSAGDPRNRKEREAAAAEAVRRSAEARALQTADAALQRIEIPSDVRLQIEDVMKPGSSLIVSDNGLSNETGKYTDFIVPLR